MPILNTEPSGQQFINLVSRQPDFLGQTHDVDFISLTLLRAAAGT
jgi:hypothetical protein